MRAMPYRIVKSTPHETNPDRRWVSLTDPMAIELTFTKRPNHPARPDRVEVMSYAVQQRELVKQAGQTIVRLTCSDGSCDKPIIMQFSPDDEAYSLSDDGTELTLIKLTDRNDMLSAASDLGFDELAKDDGDQDDRQEVAWKAAGPSNNIIESFQP